MKSITSTRVCWSEECRKDGLVTDDLITDGLLRAAVDHFKKEGTVDQEHFKQIWERRVGKKEVLFCLRFFNYFFFYCSDVTVFDTSCLHEYRANCA